MKQVFKIRYNTDFPAISRFPWRVIEIKDGIWHEVLTMHVHILIPSETTMDTMPDGRIKYHISIHPEEIIFKNQTEEKCYEMIEFRV